MRRTNTTTTFETLQKINRKSMDAVLAELRNSYFFISWKARVEEAEAKKAALAEMEGKAELDKTTAPYNNNIEVGKAM